MAIFLTGRTRTLTLNGTWSTRIKGHLSLSGGFDKFANGNYYVGGLFATASLQTDVGYGTYDYTLVCSISLPSGATGDTKTKSGTWPSPSPSTPETSVDVPMDGTYSISVDVEECVEITSVPISGDPSVPDLPAPLSYRFYERPRLGGLATLHATAGDLPPISLSKTITAADASVSVSYSARLQAGINFAEGYPLTTTVTGNFNGQALSAPYNQSYNGATASCNGGAQVSATGNGDGNGPDSNSLSADIALTKSFTLQGVIRAMSDPYPSPIDVVLTEYAGDPGTTVTANNGAFQAQKDQRQYSCSCKLSNAAQTSLSVNEWSGVSGHLSTTSLSSLGEDTDDTRLQLRGWMWGACTISQQGALDVDATPTSSHWTAGSHTSVSGSGPLAITVDSSGTGSVSSSLANARSAPDPLMGNNWQGVSFAGYRTLRLYLTAALQGSETSAPVRLTLGSKHWDLQVTGSGYVDVDLCCPTLSLSPGTVDVDGKDCQWPLTGSGP